LAAQQPGSLARQPAQHNVSGVDDVPLALDLAWLGLVRAHGSAFDCFGMVTFRARRGHAGACLAGRPTIPRAPEAGQRAVSAAGRPGPRPTPARPSRRPSRRSETPGTGRTTARTTGRGSPPARCRRTLPGPPRAP